MQTIWSRVAQTKISCRCPQCLSAANGISRRATGSATRRMPKYLTSSTLWYSGIFAAAATFDAGVKNRRREQWDLAIAELKQEVGQTASAVEEERRDAREAEEGSAEDFKVQYTPLEALLEDEDIFQHVNPLRPKPRWPTNTGPALVPHNLPPQSIYATDDFDIKMRADKMQWTPKKLACVKLSMDKLQIRLFLHLWKRGWSDEAAKAVPEEFARHIRQTHFELRQQLNVKRVEGTKLRKADPSLCDYQLPEHDISLCRYAQDNMDHVIRVSQGLNATLRELFQQQANGKITEPALLAKIAYELSTSPVPPNINTFNTLLLGFSRVQEPILVDYVIRGFRQAKMRPNEVSLMAILNHYTRTDQPTMFAKWIGLMRGKENGLMLARPDINITDAGRSRLVPREDNPSKIIQLPYATPNVFSAIITGVIKFAGFDKALFVCREMGQHGWGLCMAGLTPLLRDCADRADWKSGSAVWDRIQTLKASSKKKLGSKWVTERIRLDTYAAMLKLCTRCARRDEFEVIWDQATRIHRHSAEALARQVKGQTTTPAVEEASLCQTDLATDDHKPDTEISIDSSPTKSTQSDNAMPADEPEHKSKNYHLRQLKAARNVFGELQEDAKHSTNRPNRALREASPRPPFIPPQFVIESSEVLEQQLYGNLPPGHELDEYELRERPMSIAG